MSKIRFIGLDVHADTIAAAVAEPDGELRPLGVIPNRLEILFNLHRAAAVNDPAVVVVEGFFDCLKVHQAGFPPVVALMGAALYESQQRALLERFRRVILLLDGDPAGQRATGEITARLRPLRSLVVIPLLAQAQPDQLSSEAIRCLLQPAFGQAA